MRFFRRPTRRIQSRGVQSRGTEVGLNAAPPLNPIVRACIETLESRQLLSAAVWTGAGTDALFSDAANWQGDVVPTSGQDVTFPAGVTNTAVSISANVTVGIVEFDASYTVSSTGTLTLGSAINATLGTTTISNPIALTQSATFEVFGTAALSLSGVISGTGFGVTQQGTGILTLGGAADTYTGATTADGGTIVDLANLTSAVNVSPGSTFDGDGSITSLTSDDANIAAVNGAAGGTITIASSLALTASSGNTVSFDIGGPTASSNIIVTAGSISLGSATLTGVGLSSYTPSAGDVITLVTNNTGTPIVGTFANLPEGSTLTLAGESYQISYLGGTTGNNVTLTALAAAAGITVTASKTPIFEGQQETLTATVAGATGSLPTGNVEFYANFVPIFNQATQSYKVPLSGGVATLTTSFLPAGADVITANYDGAGEYSATSSPQITVNVRSGTPPVIEEATTNASTHGYTIAATVDAFDNSENDLNYTWSTIHAPSGAKPAIFNANNSAEAQSIIARFSKDGGYILQCKVTNSQGNSVYTNVFVTVSQKASAMRIQPHKAQIPLKATQRYSVVVLDQFNRPMRTVQALTYAVTAGPGSIDNAGFFVAGDTAGAVTIEVDDGTLIGIVNANVV